MCGGATQTFNDPSLHLSGNGITKQIAGQSSAKPSVGSWHAWLCPRQDQQVETTHRKDKRRLARGARPPVTSTRARRLSSPDDDPRRLLAPLRRHGRRRRPRARDHPRRGRPRLGRRRHALPRRLREPLALPRRPRPRGDHRRDRTAAPHPRRLPDVRGPGERARARAVRAPRDPLPDGEPQALPLPRRRRRDRHGGQARPSVLGGQREPRAHPPDQPDVRLPRHARLRHEPRDGALAAELRPARRVGLARRLRRSAGARARDPARRDPRGWPRSSASR